MTSRRKIFLFIALPLVIAAVALLLTTRGDETGSSKSDTGGAKKSETGSGTGAASWSYSGERWVASGQPPNCEQPLPIVAPTDVTKATSILYPGQYRTGGYKAHGGFRFDGLKNTDITVTVPMDAVVVEGSQYIELGELQYMFTFINDCGIAYRFDHLLALSPKFQALVDKLPAAKVDDSRTTPFEPPVSVDQGEPVATAVGFAKNQNVGFDWGVYDLRSKNKVSSDPTWAAAHKEDGQFGAYGVCWFDLLPAADSTVVKALPASSNDGAGSDYCK